jgi:hypothetical protein
MLLLAATVAFAASKGLTGSSHTATAAAAKKAAAPRALRYACARNLYNARKVLRFITRPSQCTGSGKTLVRFSKDYPVYTCRKEHGGFAARQRRFQFPNGIRSHGPAGLMRLVDDPSKCAPGSQPNETPITLPRTSPRLFCAAKKTGELRWVNKASSCDGKEFPVLLAARTSTNPGDPVANDDDATTDEDHATTINVLGNDKNTPSSSSNSGLQVDSTNANGTQGAVTVNPDGTIGYDPAGKFDSLKVGQTATDTFSYTAKKGSHTSDPAIVTITITGVNDAPVAKDDSASTDSAHTKGIPVLSNDTDADGDSLSVASVDTAGTQGTVTINGDGTVTYNPGHAFDSLATGDTGHDTFKYKANDGHVDSNAATVDVTVTGAEDPPVVTTTSGSTPYLENDPATVIDSGVTVTDPDDTDLESAQVRISDNLDSGDMLEYASPGPGGITGFYSASAGVLSLDGTASKADYQAALRSVKFQSSNDNPAATKTIEFKTTDGDLDSNLATKDITSTRVNDAPSVTTSGGNANFTEDSVPTQVDAGITVADPDSDQIQGAVASITSNFSAADGDKLALDPSPQNGITGSYNSATGVLTLSGTASKADYQTALASITFSNTSNTPSTATRTVSFKVTDTSGADSGTATEDVDVTPHNDAPTATDQSGLTTNEDNSLPVTLGGTDPEGDSLTFSHDANSAHAGTISGSGSSVTYNPATDYCGADSFNFTANDGNGGTDTGSVSITVACVNDAPTVTTSSGQASFTEDSAATQVDAGITVSDVDDTNLEGAAVSITSNFSSADGDKLALVPSPQNGISGSYNSATGILTLTGSATKANYQAALASITFSNTSNTPSTATRTVSFKVNDGDVDSNIATRNVGVTAHNDAPTATDQSGLTTNEDNSLPITLAGSDPEGDSLSFSHDPNSAHAGTISGSGTSVTYNPATDYCGPDSFNFTVNDGNGGTDTGSVSITVACVNDAPTVTTSSGSASYTEDGAATQVDPGITVSDPDDTNIEGATVSITTNFSSADGDKLTLVPSPQNGITGSYNSATGILMLTGSATTANYQAALASITFSNTSNNPSTATRTVSFKVNDGDVDSNTATRNVSVTPTNDAPVVATSVGPTSYSEGDPATVIDGGLTVSDADNTDLKSAQVRISSNFEPEDVLEFPITPNITGSYNSTSGVLSLTGTDTVTNYQAALRTVKYRHTGDNPATGKVVEFKVNDTDATAANSNSNAATKSLNITGVNDGAKLTTTVAALDYSEGSGPKAIDTGLTLDDPENNNITGATVQITSNFVQADDELALSPSPQNGISGSYDDTTGTLTLSGTTSEANYQAALRSVTFENVSDTPSGSKTVTFQTTGDDGSPSQPSNPATRNINLQPVDDAPVVTPSIGSTSYIEDGSAVAVDGGISGVTVSDADDADLESARVSITSGFQPGDTLTLNPSPQNGITGTYVPGTGVLTLNGTSSVANYQAALRSIQFSTTNDAPVSSKTIEFKVFDGDVNSNAPTKQITVTPSNDAPTITTSGGSASFSEGGSPAQVDSGLTLTDPDSASIQGATVSITANFSSADGDTLSFTPVGSITGNYVPSTGVLTLSGTDTVANYQNALESVTFSNTSDNPSSGTRTVTFQATDDSSAASSPATRNVTVTPVNDAPVVMTTGGSTSQTEGQPGVVVDSGVTVSDVDDTDLNSARVRITPAGFQLGDTLEFADQNGISGNYDATTGVLALTGTSSVGNYQTALQTVKFKTTNPNPTSSKDVEFKVNDTDATPANSNSNAPTKNIAVTAVNNAPVVTPTGANLVYTENDAPTFVDSGLSITEPEGDTLNSGSAEITSNFQSGEDALSWTDNDMGDFITMVVGPSTPEKISLTGPGTAAQYQAALSAVKYANSSDLPSTAPRTVTFSVTDTGLPSPATGTGTRGITVNPVDDPPVAVNDPGTSTAGTVTDAQTTVLEDAIATAVPVLANDTDVDAGTKTIFSTTQPTNGTVLITGGGSGLTYKPNADYCNSATGSPSATPDTFTYRLNNAGGSQATVSMTVTCVNDAPVAGTDNFTTAASTDAVGNTTFVINDPADSAPATPDPTDTGPNVVDGRPHKTVNSNVRSNDSDVDGPGPLVITGVGTDGSNGATADGGTVSVAANGHDIVFEPSATNSCTDHSDTFQYTVSDQNPGTPGTALGTVNVDVNGCVWYVNNDDAGGNLGTSEKPFDTLAQAQAKSVASSTTFVYAGKSNTGAPSPTAGYDAGYVMDTNERLLSEAADLVVNSTTLHPADSSNRPTITNNNADVVTLAGGTTVRGFTIDPQGTGGGVFGTSLGSTTVTLDNLNITDTGTKATQPGLELDTNTGTTTNVSDLAVSNGDGSDLTSGDIGVKLNSAGTVNFLPGPTITVATDGAKALDIAGTNMGINPSRFDSIAVTNSGSGGVSLANNTGAATDLGDNSGADLDIVTTSGTEAGVKLSSANARVQATGDANVSATGGPAIDVTNGGGGMAFDNVSSSGSASDGINLVNYGGSNFSATGGTIGGQTGIGFDMDGGNGTISYPGTFANPATGGKTARITGRTGGSVTFSGAIQDTTAGTGGGITVGGAGVLGNTGGTTSFTNAAKKLDTGAGDAVTMANSDGHTLSFTGGGLDIDTTSGKGVDADTSGTLDIAGTGNTIDTTTGRALSVVNTDTSGGISFDHVKSTSGQVANIVTSTGTKTLGQISTSSSGTTAMNLSSAGTVNVGDSSGPSSLTSSTASTATLASVALNINGNQPLNITKTAANAATSGVAVSGSGTVAIAPQGSGILAINSDSGTDSPGLTATGTGVITLTAGGGNTITSGGATALDVNGPSIGVADLNFKSVATNGASPGINLSNTGSVGGLNITGTGTTAGSGGTIQNASTGSATGIALNSVGGGVALQNMNITGNGNFGLSGSTVTGFSLLGSTVSNNGNVAGEAGMAFTNLTGTATFGSAAAGTADTFSGNAEDGLRVTNSTGALTMNVTGGTFSNQIAAGVANDGLLVIGNGTANQTLNVQGGTYSNNRGDHIQVAVSAGGGSPTQDVTINGTTMTSPAPPGNGVLGGGITISPAANGHVISRVTNNSITNYNSSAINHNFVSGTGTLDATVTGNTITRPTSDSTQGADGVQLYNTGNQTVNALVQNNTMGGHNFAGIDILSGDGNGSMNVTALHNTITVGNSNSFAGIFADMGTTNPHAAPTSGPDAGTSCLDLGSTTAGLKNSLKDSANPAQGGADIRIKNRFAVTVKLPGYTGPATGSNIAQLITYLQGRNDGNGTPTVTNSASSSVGWTNTSPPGSACPQPAP